MRKRTRLNLTSELVGRYVVGEINVAEIADQVGASTFKVLQELRRLGVDTSPSSRKLLRSLRRSRLILAFAPAKIPGKVVELYRSGLSLRRISTRFGLSHEGVRQILLRHGVTLRPAYRTAGRGGAALPAAVAAGF
jgi:hypothetical protein